MKTAIKVENLSKAYQLGQFSTGTISDDLKRWWALRRGKEDPYLKIGETNDRTKAGESNIVWSLKDINFEIKQGDLVGIVGRNGAGKSTLLKILSQITSPTTGSVKVNGRIASLLEVGTGFHPELSGKENIFLNGAILGMSKKEISKKFDEIVDFSGVERYLDTPVKRYSSGMYVRLAFAVAAHLESEILIVDEVLAVGDAEFQKKCLGKMESVSSTSGRTILFVSHNLQAVRQLCKNGVLLENGRLRNIGTVQDIVNDYTTFDRDVNGYECELKNDNFNANYRFDSIRILDENGVLAKEFLISKAYKVEFKYFVLQPSVKPKISFVLSSVDGTTLFGSLNNKEIDSGSLLNGGYISTVEIPGNTLNNGTYCISFHTYNEYQQSISMENALIFKAHDDGILKGDFIGGYGGYFRPKLDWKTTKI